MPPHRRKPLRGALFYRKLLGFSTLSPRPPGVGANRAAWSPPHPPKGRWPLPMVDSGALPASQPSSRWQRTCSSTNSRYGRVGSILVEVLRQKTSASRRSTRGWRADPIAQSLRASSEDGRAEHEVPDNVGELLLDSFRLAGTNSVMMLHYALLEQMLGTGLGVSGQLTGREIPGAAPEVQRS